MFKVGDLVCYGSSGVCTVAEVAPRKGKGIDPEKLYYTLRPVYGSETIYTPVDTRVFIRSALSRAEAEQLIDRIPSIPETICTERTPSLAKNYYERCLQSHACEDLIQLIKGIWCKNRSAETNGKKPGQMDLRYKKRAEDLLHGELAVALGIDRDEVASYISLHLKTQSDSSF